MAHAGEAVELDVVFGGELVQQFLRLFAQRGHFVKSRVKRMHRLAGGHQQLGHHGVALTVGVGRAALFHLGQAVVQRIDQLAPALGVVQQVVLQIGVALHHPDVAQHFVQHARRATGAALFAQGVERFPGLLAQQTDHDLAVRERGVVVRNFANALVARWNGGKRRQQMGEGSGGVHQAVG